MALIGSLSRFDTPPDLTGAKTRLRYPVAGDFAAWAELRGASRAFLAPWEPTWPHDDLTRPAFRRRIRTADQGGIDESHAACPEQPEKRLQFARRARADIDQPGIGGKAE